MRAPSLRRSGAGLLLAITAAGCGENTAPTADTALASPASIIIDAARGGQAGFYWLPPMVKQPAYSGTFDATLTGPRAPFISVQRCLETRLDVCGAGEEIARLSTTLDAQGERYRANWDTKMPGVDAGQRYRLIIGVEVALGGTPHTFGRADIVLAENGAEAKNLTSGEQIGLVDGRTLPVAFRIEQGLVEPTLYVTSLASDGPGTLRAALRAAPNGATIRFADDLCAPGATHLDGCVIEQSIGVATSLRVLGSDRYAVALRGLLAAGINATGQLPDGFSNLPLRTGRVEIDRVSFLLTGLPIQLSNAPDVRLSNLEVANGSDPNGDLPAGGIYAVKSGLTLRHVTLRNNSSFAFGSALNADQSPVTIEDSRIIGNSGEFAPALLLTAPSTIRRTVFEGNRGSAGDFGFPGVANTIVATAPVLVEDSRFIGNRQGSSLMAGQITLVRSCGRDNAPSEITVTSGTLTECPAD